MSLRKAVVLAGLAAAAPAAAADMAMPSLSYPAASAPTAVEVGTNWYVRGDIGVSFPSTPSITLPYLSYLWGDAFTPTTIGGANGQTAGLAGGAGFGYRATDYIRFDATWTYWQGPERTRLMTATCPYAFTSVTHVTPTGEISPAGYLWDTTNTCAGAANVKQHNNTFLANAYVDLGTYSGITPYVGGGIGANMNTMQASSTFIETGNGAPNLFGTYSVGNPGGAPNVWVNAAGEPLSPQPTRPFVYQNWQTAVRQTNWRFAWSLTAGVGFQLTPSFTIDIGYRYLNGGTTTLVLNPFLGLSVKQTAATQMVMVGLRFVPQ